MGAEKVKEYQADPLPSEFSRIPLRSDYRVAKM